MTIDTEALKSFIMEDGPKEGYIYLGDSDEKRVQSLREFFKLNIAPMGQWFYEWEVLTDCSAEIPYEYLYLSWACDDPKNEYEIHLTRLRDRADCYQVVPFSMIQDVFGEDSKDAEFSLSDLFE